MVVPLVVRVISLNTMVSNHLRSIFHKIVPQCGPLLLIWPVLDLYMSHLDKCCRWCEHEFGSERTRYRHEEEYHSEEIAASRLKHSTPDEDKFFKCVHCNNWSLNTLRSIQNHERSAWHKSRNIRLQKKRKPDSSSSRLPERPSYPSELSEFSAAPQKKEVLEAASSIASTAAFGR